MTPVLVDANILIDISTADPVWSEWSAEALMRLGRETRLVINPLIYSELSIAHSRIETLEVCCPRMSSIARRCLGPPPFWRGRPFWPIAGAAAFADPPCPISTSAPTPPSAAIAF